MKAHATAEAIPLTPFAPLYNPADYRRDAQGRPSRCARLCMDVDRKFGDVMEHYTTRKEDIPTKHRVLTQLKDSYKEKARKRREEIAELKQRHDNARTAVGRGWNIGQMVASGLWSIVPCVVKLQKGDKPKGSVNGADTPGREPIVATVYKPPQGMVVPVKEQKRLHEAMANPSLIQNRVTPILPAPSNSTGKTMKKPDRGIAE